MDEDFILKKMISEHLITNRKKYLLFMILLILGLLIGIISYKYLPQNESEDLKQFIGKYISYLSNGDIVGNKAVYFNNSLLKEAKIFILLWFCGLIGAGKTVSCIYILIEGFTLGFTSTIFVNTYQIEGVLFNIAGLIPQNLIKIPAILFTLVCMWSLGVSYKSKVSQNSRDMASLIVVYTLLICASFAACLIGIIFEAYVLPYLMVFISKKMI